MKWCKEQQEDQAISLILQGKETSNRPLREEVSARGPSSRVY